METERSTSPALDRDKRKRQKTEYAEQREYHRTEDTNKYRWDIWLSRKLL